MQVQLFDSDLSFLFRFHTTEQLWVTLRDVIRASLPLPGVTPNPEWDRTLSRDLAESLLLGLQESLDQLLDREAAKRRSSEFGHVQVIALGSTVWIDPRDPESHEFQRVNGIYSAIKNAEAYPLHIFTLPKLGSLEFRTSWALRDTLPGTALSYAEIRDTVTDALHAALEHERSEENRTSFARDIERATERGVIESVVAFLSEWHLAQRTPSSTARATDKLRGILL